MCKFYPRVCGSVASLFYAVCLFVQGIRAFDTLSPYIYYELLVALSNIFLLFQESFYCDLSSLANWAQLRHVSV